MLVGHNPGLHDFAVMLAGPGDGSRMHHELIENFPAGALAEFSVSRGWRTLGEGGSRLVRFVCPRDLTEAAG